MATIKNFISFINEDLTDLIKGKEDQKPFSIHDKKPGEVVNVDFKEVVIVKFLAWRKDKNATCTRFDGKLGNGTPVTVVLDGQYKIV
jgi:hypothetical protein